MKKSLTLLAVLLLLCLFLLVGCGRTNGTNEAVDSNGAEGTAAPVIVTDQMGREVTITGIPERIISLSPSNTEMIFALGLGDRLVGITEFCNYPPEVQGKEVVGGFADPNLEIILELGPNLVLASTFHKEAVLALEQHGIPVLVVESPTLAELYRSISLVAEVTGAVAAGEALVAQMQQRIQAVEKVVAVIDQEDRVRVYFEVYSDPMMSAGPGVFIHEIISLAGGVNIFGDVAENYPMVSAEVVAVRQPQVILLPDYHGAAETLLAEMAGRPGWENVPALQNNRIHTVVADIFSRPSPRIVEAVESAARLFYPELF